MLLSIYILIKNTDTPFKLQPHKTWFFLKKKKRWQKEWPKYTPKPKKLPKYPLSQTKRPKCPLNLKNDRNTSETR